MTQPAGPLTRHASAPRLWDTRDVPPDEAFEYYRDGICAGFMPLRPELPRAARVGFRSVMRSWSMPAGALNCVSARAHEVQRTRAEIAASPDSGVYVNLQLDGICTITQNGKTVALHPGEVGLFDADTPFVLDHSRRAGLRVASLLVPRSAIAGLEVGGPLLLSDHAVYGRLVAEAMQALIQAAEQQTDHAALHALLLSLVRMSAQADTQGETEADKQAPGPRADAQRARILAAIRSNASRPGWSLAQCAAELGLSPRQVQRLLAGQEDGFVQALRRERLAIGARMLRDPRHGHLPVADIALAAGYCDPAPFSRAFRVAYGASPGEWRRAPRGV